MNIVALDSIQFSQQHKTELKKLGSLKLYPSTPDNLLYKRLKDAEIVVLNPYVSHINSEILEKLPYLKYVCLCSTGYETVDLKAYRKHEVKISNLPGYSSEAVAEFVIALIFTLSRKIPIANQIVRQNPFEINPVLKKNARFMGSSIKGKTLGIVGYGTIGKLTQSYAKLIGMRTLVYGKRNSRSKLTKLLKNSDFVTLHLPLNKSTMNFFGKKLFFSMKKGSYFINTSRAQIVNQTDLIRALKSNLAGAALDVTNLNDQTSKKLISSSKVLVTPHSAWFTEQSLEKQAETILENIKSFCAGKPKNLI